MGTKRCCHRLGNYLGFQCCSDIDADNPAPFVVPTKDRFCTDLGWCFAILFMIASQGYLIHFAQQQGSDTSWLFHGIDINGTVCDSSYPSTPPKEYAMWPFLMAYDIILCTDDCNTTATDPRMLIPYKSELALDAWCLPADATTRSTFDSDWDSISESMNRAAGDIVISKYMIVASAFVTLFFCFMYMGYIGACGGIIVWVTIIFSIAGGAFLGYALITKSAQVIAMGWKFTGNLMLYTGWTLTVVTIIFTLGIIFMRSRIVLAIKVIKEAAKAMESIPTIIFFPMFCAALALCYFGYWFVGALYIFSVVEYKEYVLMPELAASLGQNTYLVDEFDKDMRDFLLYHIFGLFWVFQFIVYFCYAVMAHVFSEWYFAKPDYNEDGGGKTGTKVRGNDINEFSFHPIGVAMGRICRFHLGSIAFGAFIVAVVKFINAVFTYLQGKTAKKSNPLAVAIFCCVKCFLKCLTCCLDILSKHGLIFTAIYGTPFCHSCGTAFKMYFSNLARVAAVTVISKYLEFLGKIAITILTAGICILVMEQYEYFEERLSSLFFPALVVIVISFGVASIFMVVFEVAIDAIFLCFLIDEHCHMSGSEYATDGIKKVVDDNQKESIKQAHHMKSKTMAHRFEDDDEESMIEMHKRNNTYDDDYHRKSSKVQYVSEAKSHYGH
eukprot:75984_1